MLRRESPEWHCAWSALRRHDSVLRGARGTGSTASEHPATGEHWQYMGTAEVDGFWVHTFRHRNHPTTEQREYAYIQAGAGWRPEQETLQ